MYKCLYMPYFIVLFAFLFLLLMYGLHHCPLGAELPFPWSLAKHWSFVASTLVCTFDMTGHVSPFPCVYIPPWLV